MGKGYQIEQIVGKLAFMKYNHNILMIAFGQRLFWAHFWACTILDIWTILVLWANVIFAKYLHKIVEANIGQTPKQ